EPDPSKPDEWLLHAYFDREPELGEVDAVAAPMENDYRSVIKQLRDRNAVGVVVAVNGEIVWADLFASTDLLQKYWPKLVRSYAAESIVAQGSGKRVYENAAQRLCEEHARTCPSLVAALRVGLTRAATMELDDQKAWALRDAFDGVLDVARRYFHMQQMPTRPTVGAAKKFVN
ncbi:MAG: ARPP-1 family domain-containing protein, partial [Myxococcaceae bacterium]